MTRRLFLVALLALAVPFQAALAVSAGQCMALQHHADEGGHAHDGDPHGDSHHGKNADSHCGPCAGCCASAAIASVIHSLPAAPAHAAVRAAPGTHPPAEPRAGLERPPRSL